MIDQSILKTLLNYDPDTGLFTWAVNRGKRYKAGGKAGALNTNGYIIIRVDGESHYAHRIAWVITYGYWPKDHIDHINRTRTDNRISNLREATPKENRRNVPMLKANTSGVTGVGWIEYKGMWQARMTTDGIYNNLGLFVDKFEAICARKSAEAKKYK